MSGSQGSQACPHALLSPHRLARLCLDSLRVPRKSEQKLPSALRPRLQPPEHHRALVKPPPAQAHRAQTMQSWGEGHRPHKAGPTPLPPARGHSQLCLGPEFGEAPTTRGHKPHEHVLPGCLGVGSCCAEGATRPAPRVSVPQGLPWQTALRTCRQSLLLQDFPASPVTDRRGLPNPVPASSRLGPRAFLPLSASCLPRDRSQVWA